jgi:hypothetical protein
MDNIEGVCVFTAYLRRAIIGFGLDVHGHQHSV